MRKLAILVVIIVALVGTLIYAYFIQEDGGDEPEGPRRGAASVPVQTVPVANGTIAKKVEATGAISARAEVEVYPKQSGEIVELLVDKGDQVSAGQILAKIDSVLFEIQVKQAQADLAGVKAAYEKNLSLASISAEADFQQAKSSLDRLNSLLMQAELDLQLQEKQSETQAKKATADLHIAEARLAATASGARKQELGQAKVRVENAKRDLDRLRALHDAEMISLDQVEAAQLQHDIYSAQLSLLEEGAREEDIEVLRAQMEAAKVALQSAEDNKLLVHIKQANLGAAKAQAQSAQADFDQATVAKETATWRKELAQSQAAMKRAEAALEVAQRRLDESVLRAPISGVISQRFLDKGGMASPNRPFVTIVDVEVVKVLAKVPTRDVVDIHVGEQATIEPDAYPGQSFGGIVANISPVIDRTSQTCDVEVESPNPGRKLMPGMFTRVKLVIEEHEDVPLIPVDALVKDEHKLFVYVISDGKALRKEVTTGINDGIRTEVLSGLKSGDEFIMAGKYSLQEGMSITLAGPNQKSGGQPRGASQEKGTQQ